MSCGTQPMGAKLDMRILRSIFGRQKTDARDLDQLIFDLAEYGNRPPDIAEFYRRLPELSLFAKVVSANFSFKDGVQYQTGPGDNLKTSAVSLPSGHVLAEFFVDQADPRLGSRSIGMSSQEALEMVLKIGELHGLIVRNSNDSWIALLKPEIQRLLNEVFAGRN